MSNNEIDQALADHLLSLEKVPIETNKIYEFPSIGGNKVIPLKSKDGHEFFVLNIHVKNISLKTTYQTRARQSIVLARLDFNSPHRNPDGKEIGVPHLHIYKEGFGDKIAIEVPDGMLSNPSDSWQNLLDFLKFCNIEEPTIDRGLPLAWNEA